ncbi:TetR/AcrR family transcriptional regulator [Streptomyces sp. MST-110588]|uniref:TetR/AcrR family transcriptional regulator n=1 Tax=Streptomyces sp. MST-110588 TaxID=2833628 RepID=UPI001F5DFE40|nr:TetR/AcrR family transcriptional regulator [Streptomyces sp. MST-110588]UNO38815.1 TetR/AcrR family transcriptional regulator [Streptomyces sp. MST-110588]
MKSVDSAESARSLRERLIDVGVELVTAEGTASLGLREIARRAGVSHGAPRRYFPTHHSLLSAIARRGFADLHSRFEAAVAGTAPPREQLEALGREYLTYAFERRGMYELMFRHDLLDSESGGISGGGAGSGGGGGSEDSGESDRCAPGQPRLRESTLPLFEHFTGLVARCRKEREPAPGRGAADTATAGPTPAAVTAAALWSNLHGLAQLWAWGSLPLALGVPPQPAGEGRETGRPDRTSPSPSPSLDSVVRAVLDAHLGPVRP